MRTIRLIDRGGFGVVHEVEVADGTRLARKSFDPRVSTDEEREKLLRRFRREVRIQSQLRHPNIMPIRDFDLDADPPWFTMPLALRSFESKIADDRAAGTFDSSPWQDILAAVEELHRLGYVHRDLKPANVLLVEDDWVLSDFGLILPTSRETTVLTGTKSAYGSFSYAAPEQARDFRNTPDQADIFALGCILHDTVEIDPSRIPFAQVRSAGPYGPILEKCTEVDVRKRFPNIAALRSALFDLWRTAHYDPPSSSETSLLEAVTAGPDNLSAWRALIGHAEQATEREAILRALSSELLQRLGILDDILFARAVHMICEWAQGSAFDWDYCDVVGDRLLEAYRLAPVRVRCNIVVAALELATSHNRWHVMNQVGAMLGPAADNGLVDRMVIEMNLDSQIAGGLRKIERTVRWRRDAWHEKITVFLNASELPDA